jgi:helicase
MRTADYPYFQPSFVEFNKAQKVVVPYFDKDVNLVVSFPTAVGKTVIAECCFGFHLSTDDKSRVIYVSPLRRLTAEKYESWEAESQFSGYGIMQSTGEDPAPMKDFENSRMALLTSESFDSKTRVRAYQDWLKTAACIVIDEAHLIGHEKRGGAVENALMRFTAINPNARLVLLSATMSNSMEIAKWIKSLNGKETKHIKSDWRPVKIRKEFYEIPDGNESKIRSVVKHIKESDFSGKTIVFVHSKSVGKEIASRLSRAKIKSAFHNADLSKDKRAEIEKLFDDPYSGLDVLVSTSTLGAGVNIG